MCRREDPDNLSSLSRFRHFGTDCELIGKLIPRPCLAPASHYFRRLRTLQRFAFRAFALASPLPTLSYILPPHSVLAHERRPASSIGVQVVPAIAALLSFEPP